MRGTDISTTATQNFPLPAQFLLCLKCESAKIWRQAEDNAFRDERTVVRLIACSAAFFKQNSSFLTTDFLYKMGMALFIYFCYALFCGLQFKNFRYIIIF